jgi:hypothetical protein
MAEYIKASVWFDGAEQDHVVTIDTERGYIERYKTGEDGQLIIDLKMGGLAIERLTGDIRVKIAI